MGYRQFELVLFGAHGLEPRPKSVLLILGSFCKDEKSFAFPSERTLAAISGMGERRVRECLTELVERGWITPVPGTGRGPGNPTKYSLDFAAMHDPARQFIASMRAKPFKGLTITVAKPANVSRNKPADVSRKWTDEKRRNLAGKAADWDANAAHVGQENRRTGAEEPGSEEVLNGVEPGAPAATPTEPQTSRESQDRLKETNGEPEGVPTADLRARIQALRETPRARLAEAVPFSELTRGTKR